MARSTPAQKPRGAASRIVKGGLAVAGAPSANSISIVMKKRALLVEMRDRRCQDAQPLYGAPPPAMREFRRNHGSLSRIFRVARIGASHGVRNPLIVEQAGAEILRA